MKQRKYGLFTAIAMIIGVVIGSGIFFKSDNILIATGGNIGLGVLAFCIAAISIIFGSLTVAELAARNDTAGGIISYAESAYNGGVGCAFGWFQMFLYYPTLIAVVSYIVGVYSCLLFNIEGSLEIHILIGLTTVLFFFLVNLLSTKIPAYFQNIATIIKLIPLILIGVSGFIFGNPQFETVTHVETIQSSSWIAALAPIVFAFDGWIVTTSISHEIKNAKKNIPLALILSPIFILIIYLAYFIGMSIYLGPETIMTQGDIHVNNAAISLFGPWAAKALLVFIIISVAGTANGLMMALFQLPYSLGLRKMFPCSSKMIKIHSRFGTPCTSGVVALAIILFWTLLHYITQKYNLLPNSDVSEIAITFNYIGFILLYAHVFRLGLKGEIKGFWKSKMNPLLATIGSLIILYVGMQNPLFWMYLIICIAFMIAAYLFWKKNVA
ncbi:amino acid permease [Sporanaerobium hydrogeniformans]|uniref:Amino acid permease n=1 Tax=Sporanaerobium hydrogeniformans TaxID=3072179 RepID=A0AC61DDA1_9FIRM|nr:APC family permease [Sporanaerobium hydrogeniformans]PHV71184.1 amino acid permease [Sporanaerobium hydrogeniformans]